MTVTRPKKSAAFRTALSLSVAMLLVLCIVPISVRDRVLIAGIMAVGWMAAGAGWITRRFGKKGLVALAGLGLILGGAAISVHLLDEPNRLLVSQIKDLGACQVDAAGLFTTTVWAVHFGSDATDGQVQKFTELEGLDDLDMVTFKGTKLSDGAVERLARFSRLSFVNIDGAKLRPMTANRLRDKLPKCRSMVNGSYD